MHNSKLLQQNKKRKKKNDYEIQKHFMHENFSKTKK